MWIGIGKVKTLLKFLFVIIPIATYGQTISLSAELDKDEIWLGETVRLTITLTGSEDPFKPVLLLPGVKVETLGGSRRSSESVTSVNGRVTRQVRLAYVYVLDLTPDQSGTVSIPPIDLEVGGVSLHTQPLNLVVNRPRLMDGYHLLLNFEPERQYVKGEFRLGVTFLFSGSVRNLSITIPELERYEYIGLAPTGNTEKYQLAVNGSNVFFKRDDQEYQGIEHAGITAEFSVRSQSPGTEDFGDATARFEAVIGTDRVRDMFGRIQDQPAYGSLAVFAHPVSLEILPFPSTGKPANFSGFSGDVHVSASAEPRKVHLGDPITLILTFNGLEDPELSIPSLGTQLGPGFNTPATRSDDVIDGGRKTVTQTIRVVDRDVKEIPALSFSYFDTEREEYKTASTYHIALELLETEIITSANLEGGEQGTSAETGKTLVEEREEGM